MSAPSPAPPGVAPVLLTSLTAAALLDGRGDLELVRETRGADVDWGGVIGQCVRLTGPWRFALESGDAVTTLPATLRSASPDGAGWVSHHEWNGFGLDQRVAVVDGAPGVVRILRCTRVAGPPASLTVTSSFAPYLLPVLVEGIRPHLFRVKTGEDEVRMRQRGFGLAVRSNVPPAHLFLNRGSWIGGRYRGRVDEVGFEYVLSVSREAPVELRVLIAGGVDRWLEPGTEARAAIVADPESSIARVGAADRAWTESTPTLRFPDAPALERGYGAARAALRRLYSAPAEALTGLVAGYPWYSALWGRDIAWMLPALLWLGDLDWVRRSVDTALRFQARGTIAVLGAEPGEMPMQVSPGPIFFYGTSDTTLYYPVVIEQWARHAGATALPDGWADALGRMIAWAEARTDPATGLLRNGGEAESISSATSSLARVRYGIDSPDTTIWDSTDRRDHAIDLQVLFGQALGAATALRGDSPDVRRWQALADRLATAVRSRYAWGAEGYLYDTIRAGVPVGQLRPNALRAVSAGLLPLADGRRLVERVARDDLTTPWGVRTLSARDPGYRPDAYHDGQVWPIATAWAADAALAVGDADRGVAYLETIANRYAAEGGYANECYRGDRPEPFDSCFLLGFSVAPYLSVLFERLWGLRLDTAARRLTVRPTFPRNWRSAAIDGLRVGRGTVSLDWSPERLRSRWFGEGNLTVETGSERAEVAPGGSRDLAVGTAGR